jgi:hypothetical protein
MAVQIPAPAKGNGKKEQITFSPLNHIRLVHSPVCGHSSLIFELPWFILLL